MAEDIARLREVAEAATPGPWRVSHAGAHVWADRDAAEWDAFHVAACSDALGKEVERSRNDAVHIATFDPPTVLALLDRLDAAEAALGKVLGLAEAATEQAYMQIATEKMLTIQPTALGGAKVPPHWRTEAEAGATIAVPTLLAALASTQREER